MASIVGSILDYIESSVVVALPSIKKSPYYYALNNNAGISKYEHVFAIRPADGNPESGTMGNVTIKQEFEVEIGRSYKGNDRDDVAQREAIDQIYDDNERVMQKLCMRSQNNVKIVGQPSFSSPDIDETAKLVSITFTYPITYTKSLRNEVTP